MDTLELRMTHKYVGSYQHEDMWKAVGTFEVTHTEKWRLVQEEEGDPTNPLKHIYQVMVSPSEEATVEEVRQALQDSFTQVGCHHEYDCCGCRSFYATRPVQLSDDNFLWQVEVNSWRNY